LQIGCCDDTGRGVFKGSGKLQKSGVAFAVCKIAQPLRARRRFCYLIHSAFSVSDGLAMTIANMQ
jgi:hypothetical protein